MQNHQNHTQDYSVTPLIGFIVTYYNQPISMLTECIDSICQLPLGEDEREIIVIDDGSSVNPLNHLTRHEDMIIYVRQRNSGVSVARNKGIEMAKSTYLQFIDADDKLIPETYQTCIDELKRAKPDLLAFSHAERARTRKKTKVSQIQSGVDYMLHHNLHGAVWGYIVKRSIIGEQRFTAGVAYGEDEEFTAQLMLRAETLITTDAEAYFYRQHSNSMLHKIGNTQKRLSDTFYVICRLDNMADRLPAAEKEAMKRRTAQLTMDYIYNVMTLTQDIQQVEDAVSRLESRNLFPLPDKHYTKKYVWFRKLTNHALGRKTLCQLLSHIQ